ncbi:hypothetical protein RHMOL_Rhmol02G0239500 [Rhododendron molle]|uniref:Uncharacterized protein n=1 Tax=Rhododendron molle TaxID=49168 RepID=A0ACC0PTY8_RHOML|nr:hypothetical protein RHMOL_Rhmol02G0239500 [Rhododendron molle]
MVTTGEITEIDSAAAPPITPNVLGETATRKAGDELSWKELLEYETLVQNLSGRISSLQKSAFTLANFYFISQAVVFTALSTNTSLVCHDFWFPLFLSLLPGGLNLVAFFKIGQEYIETKFLQNTYKELWREGELHKFGRTGVIRVFDDNNTKIVEKIKKKWLTRNLCCCMCAFGLLAAVVAVGSLWMLCGKSIIFKLKHHAK